MTWAANGDNLSDSLSAIAIKISHVVVSARLMHKQIIDKTDYFSGKNC